MAEDAARELPNLPLEDALRMLPPIVWATSGPRPRGRVSPQNDETPALAGVSLGGRYWARTSDPQLVELVLSQLS